MAEPIAGPRRSRRRATKTRSSRVWQGEREVMQNRSNRGSGKPVWVRAHQAREFDWDPIRRIALGPAVMKTASTGRTHDCTRPTCINVKTNLANREPSTHDCTRPTCINVKTNLANREPSTHDPMGRALVRRLHDLVADRLLEEIARSQRDRRVAVHRDRKLTLEDIDECRTGVGVPAADEARWRRKMHHVHTLSGDSFRGPRPRPSVAASSPWPSTRNSSCACARFACMPTKSIAMASTKTESDPISLDTELASPICPACHPLGSTAGGCRRSVQGGPEHER